MKENDDFLEDEELQEMQQKKQQKKSFWNNKKTVKGKALSAWLITIVVIFMLITFGLGMFLGKELAKSNEKKGISKPDNTVVDDNNVDNNQNVNDFTNRFITAALFSDEIGYGIASKFTTGYTSLTLEDKLDMTYNSLVKINPAHSLISEVPEKYKNVDYWDLSTGIQIYELSLDLFKEEYKNLFKEELTADLKTIGINGCPGVFEVDEELGYIYMSNQCGGIASPIYKYSTFNNSQDDSYYYVDQYVGVERTKADGTLEFVKPSTGEIVDVTSFEGNEDKFDKIQWKFDKNVNFISTEIME